LQLPGIAFVALLVAGLWRGGIVSAWTAGCLLALWIAKDAAFYPLLRKAYESGGADGAARLVGRTAVVRRRLAPRGYVGVGAELWRAELQDGAGPVEPGSEVRVVGARRLTLIVVPVAAGDDH
jgi:membrane protein implicated in regulation of membrane protease activity